MEALSPEINLCTHCGLEAIRPVFNEDKVFCCFGCKNVYSILESNNLLKFYDLRKSSTFYRDALPVSSDRDEFAYLDRAEFLADYAIEYQDKIVLNFFVEGIHCSACMWLIEKLDEYFDNISSIKVNLSNSTIKLCVQKDKPKISNIIQQLSTWGYRAHPIANNEQLDKLSGNSDKNDLVRIGVAAACMGNIMLFSISIYAGAQGHVKSLFEVLSMLLFIPTLLYSAKPFFIQSYQGLIQKRFSIDIPIALALILGTMSGLSYLFFNIGQLYFDTLSSLVFLILGSRFLLKKTRQKGLDGSDLKNFFSHSVVYKKENEGFFQTTAKYIKLGDVLKILPNTYIPVETKVLEGESYLDTSFISGESMPIKVSKGALAISGSKNLSNDIIVEVTSTLSNSRISHILNEVEEGNSKKSSFLGATEKYAKLLIITSIISAVVVFLYISQQYSYEEGVFRALSILIITCPCALGLIVPLVFSNSLKILAKKSVIVKDPVALEKVKGIKNIFLDKTGTLTHGKFKVKKIIGSQEQEIANLVYSLELQSSHPIALSLVEYFQSEGASQVEVQSFQEIVGQGVQGVYNGCLWEIKNKNISLVSREDKTSESYVGLYRNQELVTTFILEDSLRAGIVDDVKILKKNFNLYLLSGDKKTHVLEVANKLGINPDNCFWEMTPESKRAVIKQTPSSLMIGDGANDAAALSEAQIGMATRGNAKIGLRVCDVYSLKEGISSLRDFLYIANSSHSQIKKNILIAFIYNIIGVSLAAYGYVGPFFAAVFMPVSTLFLTLINYVDTRNLNRELGVIK